MTGGSVKLALFGDIHANIFALKAACEAALAQHPDKRSFDP